MKTPVVVELSMWQRQYLRDVSNKLIRVINEGSTCKFNDDTGFWPVDLYIFLDSVLTKVDNSKAV